MAGTRLRLLGLVAVLVTAATACSGGDGAAVGGGGGARAGTTVGAAAATTQAAELRAGLTYLLVEDVDLVGLATAGDSSVRPSPGTSMALEDSARAVSMALASPYPTTQALVLAAGQRRHAALLAEARARRARDPAGAAAARADLAGQSTTFAQLLHAVAPALAVTTVTATLRAATAPLVTAVDALAVDAPDAPALLALASARTRPLAALLAEGVAAALHLGPTTTPAADARATLTAVLVDHVYRVAAAAVPSRGRPAAARALDDGAVALARALARTHAEVEAPLLATWREHIGFLEAYARARAASDPAAAEAARRGLDGDRRSFGATAHQAVPPLPASTVAAALIPHVSSLLTALAGLVAGDPAAALSLRAATRPMPGIAAVLAGGIAEADALS